MCGPVAALLALPPPRHARRAKGPTCSPCQAGNIELLGKLMTEANKEFYRVGGVPWPSLALLGPLCLGLPWPSMPPPQVVCLGPLCPLLIPCSSMHASYPAPSCPLTPALWPLPLYALPSLCTPGAICPSQLTAPMLHKCLEHPSLQPYILGGKGVGAKMSRPRHFLLTLHYTKVYDAQDT